VVASGTDLGFEVELFKAADKLRGNLEPSEYKHVALGLIFLKYISDAFDSQHAKLETEDQFSKFKFCVNELERLHFRPRSGVRSRMSRLGREVSSEAATHCRVTEVSIDNPADPILCTSSSY